MDNFTCPAHVLGNILGRLNWGYCQYYLPDTNTRIHVLCAAEQKEHAGCYADFLVLKVYQKSDKDILLRSSTVLSRMLYDAALVARLC